MTATRKLFFDMDGVVVDFAAFMLRHGLTANEVKKLPGAYLAMPPVHGAIAGIRKAMSLAGQFGAEVWLATKPPTGIPIAYADKVAWVLHNLPELKRRIILTHDKGILGGEGDYLIDDRPERANCAGFRGTLVHFGVASPEAAHPAATVGVSGWGDLLEMLHESMRSRATEAVRRMSAPRIFPVTFDGDRPPRSASALA